MPEDKHPLLERVSELRAALSASDPLRAAKRTGATFLSNGDGQCEFRLNVWGKPVRLTYPEFEAYELENGQACNPIIQAFLAYYFSISDGTPLTGRWIAFSELPEGRFYTQAFQGYTGNELAKTFGNDIERFTKAALECGGRPVLFGDAAFAFEVLPYVALLVVCWQGDDDFPASYQILIDASLPSHLPTEACAILGAMLTRRFQKAA